MTFRLKAASGGITGQTFDLDERTTIGSAGNADIRLEGLDEKHAIIVYDDEILTLSGVPGSGVWVNGEPVTSRPLRSGDEIRLGEYRFVLQAPGLRPPSVLRDKPARRFGKRSWAVMAIIAAAVVATIAYYVVAK